MNIEITSITNICKLFALMLAFGLPQLSDAQDVRSIDGYGNNLLNPSLGSTFDEQIRLTPADYLDGIGEPNQTRPNPREISNLLFDQAETISDKLTLSDFTWVFGQFIDHDITLVENGEEPMLNIVVPANDENFPVGSVIRMSRNKVKDGSGISTPRIYQNDVTSFIDGSAIYGSDSEVADWLRTFKDGKLKVSKNNMLPWNTIDGEFNSIIDYDAPFMADDTRSLTKYYIAGDVRANENPLLLSFHTLFVREHNRRATVEKELHPGWNDERLYQAARKYVIGVLQNIVYYEWLPTMGVEITPYTGYKSEVKPRISNEFSSAAFRLGHTLLNGNIIRMDNSGNELSSGNIQLRDAFFNPTILSLAGGIDPYFKGMATQVQQDFDCKVIDDVRNFLFGAPGQGGLDLAAININRGRDRGITDFNSLRIALGLPRYSTFEDLTDSPIDAQIMQDVYGDIDNVDAWVGMLAEKRDDDKLFGKVVSLIMEKQFDVLRNGDRLYFENNQFSEDLLAAIKGTSMRDILMRNTDITLMQEKVFEAMPHDMIEEGPDLIPFPLDAVIYPNPVSETLSIKMYSDIEETISLSIINYMGNTIINKEVHVYKGSNYIEVPVTDCPRGFYNVLLEDDRRFKILKMVKE